jgi:hypothetical protein
MSPSFLLSVDVEAAFLGSVGKTCPARKGILLPSDSSN